MTAFTKYKPRELLLFWIAFWITRLLQQLQTARTFTWASKPWFERNERRFNRCHVTRPFRTWHISKLKPFVLGLLVHVSTIYIHLSRLNSWISRIPVTSELAQTPSRHRSPGTPPESKTSILRIVPVVAHPSGHSFLLSFHNRTGIGIQLTTERSL